MSFDLRALHDAIDAEREQRGLSWSALAREIGVSASTLRRFGDAIDAEADGVLTAVAWLGAAPERFIEGNTVDEVQLPAGPGRFVRVDMQRADGAKGEPSGSRARQRTTIQRLVATARGCDRPVASLTRRSET